MTATQGGAAPSENGIVGKAEVLQSIKGELLARGLAPNTATNYRRVIARAEDWCMEQGYDLASVPSGTIMEWVHEQPRSWSSRSAIRSALSHYWEIVGRTDTPTIKLPPMPQGVCRALEEDDAELLARVAVDRQDDPGLAVLIGLYLALRREEIARLRWSDFGSDWERCYVVGKRAVTRYVPVHPWLAEYMQAWPRRSAFVFPSDWGKRPHVCPATIWNWCRRVADESGIGQVATHVLRHTALAQANDRTGDLRAVQHFAGHAHPNTTAIYTRTTKARLQAVVLSLDFAQGPRSRGPSTAEEDGGRLRLVA